MSFHAAFLPGLESTLSVSHKHTAHKLYRIQQFLPGVTPLERGSSIMTCS